MSDFRLKFFLADKFLSGLRTEAEILLKSGWSTMLLAALLLAIICVYLLLLQQVPTLVDFHVYFGAAETLSLGGNPYQGTYDSLDNAGWHWKLSYLYPPPLAAVLSFFVPLGEKVTAVMWFVLNLAALAGTGVALRKIAFPEISDKNISRNSTILCVIAVIIFQPASSALYWGQISSLVVFLLALFVLLFRRHPVFAGICLGASVLLKVTPAILLIGVIRFRQTRVLAGFCVPMLLCLIALTSHQSRQAWKDFSDSLGKTATAEVLQMTRPGQMSSGPQITHGLQILDPLIKRLLPGTLGSSEHAAAVTAIRLAVIGLFLITITSLAGRPRDDELCLMGILVCAMIVISPIIWVHHLLWWLVPLALVIRFSRKSIFPLILAALMYILLSAFWQIYDRREIAETAVQLLVRLVPVSIAAITCVLLTLGATEKKRLNQPGQ